MDSLIRWKKGDYIKLGQAVAKFNNTINQLEANENLVEGFYNLALAESVKYDRLSGYFSSASLSLAEASVCNCIDNESILAILTLSFF